MPYVNIDPAGTLTCEQKRKIAEFVTDTLERIANRHQNLTYISFDDLFDESWAIAGELLGE